MKERENPDLGKGAQGPRPGKVVKKKEIQIQGKQPPPPSMLHASYWMGGGFRRMVQPAFMKTKKEPERSYRFGKATLSQVSLGLKKKKAGVALMIRQTKASPRKKKKEGEGNKKENLSCTKTKQFLRRTKRGPKGKN